jgi:protein-disulfide isomerase
MKSLTIPLAIIAAGAILAGAVYVSVRSDLPSGAQYGVVIRAISPNDHTLGNPAARLTIIVYSDFDCAHCKIFSETLHQIVNDYAPSGDVAWVARNLALTELNPHAKQHAEAAECVAQISGTTAYFAFSDLLFANQPANPLNYAEYSKKVSAPPDAIADCIQNAPTNGIDARIDADRAEALALGAQGTPYSLIVVARKTPIVIDSAWPYPDLKDQIETALRDI